MRTTNWIASSIAIVGLAAGALAFQDDKKAMPAAAGKDDPMMEAMMKAGTPGAAHKALESKIGKWTTKAKFYMPGAPAPMEMEFKSEARWIMDGRFVQETVTGDFMGAPFMGTGTWGYDNIKKKYVNTWMDNMSTSIMIAEGTYDAATKTFSYMGECPDMTATKYVKCRSTDTMTDADHGTAKSWMIGPDGKEALTFEMTYPRAKLRGAVRARRRDSPRAGSLRFSPARRGAGTRPGAARRARASRTARRAPRPGAARRTRRPRACARPCGGRRG
jgi:hypothetical protein